MRLGILVGKFIPLESGGSIEVKLGVGTGCPYEIEIDLIGKHGELSGKIESGFVNVTFFLFVVQIKVIFSQLKLIVAQLKSTLIQLKLIVAQLKSTLIQLKLIVAQLKSTLIQLKFIVAQIKLTF